MSEQKEMSLYSHKAEKKEDLTVLDTLGFFQTSLICLQCRRPGLDSWVGRISWRRDRLPTPVFLGFPCGSAGQESACNAETWVRSLGWEDPLEKGKATYSSILAWRIPWTIQSMGLQRAGQDGATFSFFHWRYLKTRVRSAAGKSG